MTETRSERIQFLGVAGLVRPGAESALLCQAKILMALRNRLNQVARLA